MTHSSSDEQLALKDFERHVVWGSVKKDLVIEDIEAWTNLLLWLSDDAPIYYKEAFLNNHQPKKNSAVNLSRELAGTNIHTLKQRADMLRVFLKGVQLFQEIMSWNIDLPMVPVVVPREQGLFTPHRFSTRDRLPHWKERLDRSIRADITLNDQEQLGRLLLSAIINGGLLNSSLLEAVLESLDKPISTFNGRAYLELNVQWLGRQSVEFRRWFLDPVTETLIVRNLVPIGPVSKPTAKTRSTQRMFSWIKKFIRKSGVEKQKLPKHMKELLDLASLYFELRLPPIVVNYNKRKQLSYSLPDSCLLRLRNELPEGAQPTANKHSVGNGGISEPPSINQKHRFHKLYSGLQQTELEEIDLEVEQETWRKLLPAEYSRLSFLNLHEKVKAHPEHRNSSAGNDIRTMILGWTENLVLKCINKETEISVKSIVYYANSLDRRLGPMCTDVRLTEAPESWFVDIYAQVLDDASSKNMRRKLARMLSRLHEYMVRVHDVVEIDQGEVLGERFAPTPVDANILWLEEYETAMTLLEQSDLDLHHPDYPVVAKLLLMLGYRCGLRRSESLKLLISDIHGKYKPELLVRPHAERRLKTKNSTRKIPLWLLLEPQELNQFLKWVNQREKEEEASRFSPYLFCLKEKSVRIVSGDHVYVAIHKAMRMATGDKTVRYHHLRHSFATLTLLRLMISDLFSCSQQLPEPWCLIEGGTKKWLESCEEFRSSLYEHEHATRKHLYYVSSWLGHSFPDISLEHYVHCMDFLSAELIRLQMHDNPENMVGMGGAPQATEYRWSKNSQNDWMQVLRKYHGYETTPLTGLRREPPEILDAPVLGDVTPATAKKAWKALYLYSKYGLGADALSERLVLDEGRLVEYINTATALSKIKTGGHRGGVRFRMSSFSDFATGKNCIVPTPTNSSADEQLANSLFNGCGRLSVENPDCYKAGLVVFRDRTWNTKHQVVVKTGDDANAYVSFLIKSGIRPDQVNLTVLHGRLPSRTWIADSGRQWRASLPLTKPPISFEPYTKGFRGGSHGWLAINLHTIEGSPEASSGLRYALTMMLIMSGMIDI